MIDPMEYGDPYIEWNEANDYADDVDDVDQDHDRDAEILHRFSDGYVFMLAVWNMLADPEFPAFLDEIRRDFSKSFRELMGDE